jgi:hypothetical protein
MIFKKLTREEVLEVIMMMASESIPKNIDGEITADLDEDGNAEIFFVPKVKEKEWN